MRMMYEIRKGVRIQKGTTKHWLKNTLERLVTLSSFQNQTSFMAHTASGNMKAFLWSKNWTMDDNDYFQDFAWRSERKRTHILSNASTKTCCEPAFNTEASYEFGWFAIKLAWRWIDRRFNNSEHYRRNHCRTHARCKTQMQSNPFQSDPRGSSKVTLDGRNRLIAGK